MAFDVKSIETTVENWKTVTPGRAGYWQSRTISGASRWLSNALAGIANWKVGVSAASAEALLRAGLNRAGTAKFTSRVNVLGSSRFGQGISAAESDYRTRMSNVLQVIASAPDPGRFARGDPRNYQRGQSIGQALNRARLQAQASGG